jgi:ribosomal protein L7Ae-like RNA K-turn-binding protein
VPPDLTRSVQAALERRVADILGLARRAGQAVHGFTKARIWLDGGRVGVIVQASDGSAEERARFMGAHAGKVPVVSPLTGSALGALFGQERVVHVAVAAGRLADVLLIDAARLAGLSDDTGAVMRAGVRGGAHSDGTRAADGTAGPAGRVGPTGPGKTSFRVQAGK